MIPLKLHRQPRVAAIFAALAIAADLSGQDSADPLITPATDRRLVVSFPDRKLALVENGELVKLYDVAIGARSTPTPAGVFEIVNRISEPTWYGPKKIVRPGKSNPLGTRWMGLSLKGYGIHGTNNPSSIGKMASHGCIRMRNADVEDLFERVSVGDVVEFIAQPDPQVARWFRPAEIIAD